MPLSATQQLIKIFADGQTQMLNYLKRADERGERQSRATLKALGVIQEGQKTLHDGQKILHDGQKTLHDGQKTLHDGLERMTAMLGEITRMSADVAFMANEARREAQESKERVIDLAASIRKN